jgi:lipopolysaccharide transport system ATP-binding protein
MPLLPVGDYSIAIAIANGSQEQHEQQHWVHDALLFKSGASSAVGVLIGISMQEIKLQRLEPELTTLI